MSAEATQFPASSLLKLNYMIYIRNFKGDLSELENTVTFMAFSCKEHSICMDELCSNISKLVEGDPNKIEEIVKLCSDIYLKARTTDSNVPEFWKLLSEESYPDIQKVAFYLTAFFWIYITM